MQLKFNHYRKIIYIFAQPLPKKFTEHVAKVSHALKLKASKEVPW